MNSINGILMVYIFPLQLIIGLLGNVINLVVLLNRMRSKTNILLAMVAFSDILFLIFMLPHTLMYHNNLMKIQTLRTFILYGAPHITGIVNMCSFASAWLIVIICIERMMAIICPLKARGFWTWQNLKFIMLLVWITGALSSMHSHITHTVTVVIRNEIFNNSKDLMTRSSLQSIVRPEMEKYWKIATLLNVVFVVFIPVILVVGANTLMIWHLSRYMTLFCDSDTKKKWNECVINSKINKRVTFIVIVISSTFTLCQTPSALVHIWEIIWPSIGKYPEFRTIATLSNSLVVTGKTANLFLFCMWSENFRRNLYIIFSNYVPCRFYKETIQKSSDVFLKLYIPQQQNF